MDKIYERFQQIGVIPVIAIDDAKDAAPLGRALCEGGLPAAEVTFRTAAGEETIRTMAKEFPEMLVGAGTVLTIDQVNRAADAGARFVVSPGFDPKIVEYCLCRGIPVCPGTCTPSEMLGAMDMGLDVVKFFPAEPAGGLNFIKAVTAALTSIKIMPTGGINLTNLRDYLSFSKILCCGGTWMVKKDLIRNQEFDRIREISAEAAAIVKEIRG